MRDVHKEYINEIIEESITYLKNIQAYAEKNPNKETQEQLLKEVILRVDGTIYDLNIIKDLFKDYWDKSNG